MTLIRNPPPAEEESQPEYFDIYFRAMRLYLNDLEDVHRALLDRCQTVRITAGEAIAEYVEDLREATQDELAHVTFTTSDPATAFNFGYNPHGLTLDLERGKPVVESIHRLVRQRETRAPSRYYTPRVFLALAGVLVAGGLLLWGGPEPKEDSEELGASQFAFIVAIALPVSGLYVFAIPEIFRRTRFTVIIPERRETHRGLSAQARSQLTVGVAAGLMAAVAGSLITWLLTR